VFKFECKREKDIYVILKNVGLNGWEWEVKIKTYEGFFAKVKNLLLNSKYRWSYPKDASVV
jgi:hypothetical protein